MPEFCLHYTLFANNRGKTLMFSEFLLSKVIGKNQPVTYYLRNKKCIYKFFTSDYQQLLSVCFSAQQQYHNYGRLDEITLGWEPVLQPDRYITMCL